MDFIKDSNNLIRNRYSILNKIGKGGVGNIYVAFDKKSNQQVAIKVLSFLKVNNWKKIELFKREAKILQQLNHSAIPQYIDYFQIQTENNVYFCIVQQLALGQSLFALIDKGWRPNEVTVKEIAKQILDILIYLQTLTPPVIHRDIKPQNIIYQPDKGELFLVDFGAIQYTCHHDITGSTVVGTYGYMAPEQYRGCSFLSTDLYGLGCTLLFLLTAQSPAELPQNKLKIIFRSSVNIKRDFANWIEKLIEPDFKTRFIKAIDALAVLDGEQKIQTFNKTAKYKIINTSIKIFKNIDRLIIAIPPILLCKYRNRYFYFIIAWYIFLSLNILAFSLSNSWYGFVYILCYFLRFFIPSNQVKNIYFMQGIIVFLLTPGVFVLFKTHPIFLFSLIIIIIDILIKPKNHHKLIREIIFSTYIIIEDQKIIIKRGFANFYQKEYFYINKMNKEKIKSFFLIELLTFNQENEYQFGGLLDRAIQSWLVEEITKYKVP